MTSEEFRRVIQAAQLIEGIQGICGVNQYGGGQAQLLPDAMAAIRPADAKVRVRKYDTRYPWEVFGVVDGVRVFAIMSDEDLRQWFPDLVPEEAPAPAPTQEEAVTGEALF